MAAKKKQKRGRAAEFVRSRKLTESAKSVVAAGKKAGIAFTESTVYNARAKLRRTKRRSKLRSLAADDARKVSLEEAAARTRKAARDASRDLRRDYAERAGLSEAPRFRAPSLRSVEPVRDKLIADPDRALRALIGRVGLDRAERVLCEVRADILRVRQPVRPWSVARAR